MTYLLLYLFVDDLHCFSTDPGNRAVELLVYDTLVLFADLLSHGSVFVAGVGSACLRHLVVAFGAHFTPALWQLVVGGVWRAVCLSVLPVRKLILKFVPNSVDLNGDIGEVHVVVPQDAQALDLAELRIMAHQIFCINRPSTKLTEAQLEAAQNKPQFAYVFVFVPKSQQQHQPEG